VFEVGFAEIARTLGRGEAACRQLAARAREHVRAARPRFAVSAAEGERLALAFRAAARSGDAAALAQLLAEDAVLYSDGGGKRAAALNPIRGRDKIMRFLVGIAKKAPAYGQWRVEPAQINGAPGLMLREPDGAAETIAFDIAAGRIAAIYIVLNPEKLRHIAV
jgi:RNA polymerase sigma-70 factor, ECF subfamily